jgi:acetyltransferase-like isoleucine patch superfamily enzyme
VPRGHSLLERLAESVWVLHEAIRRTARVGGRARLRRRFLACGDDVVFDPLSSDITYEQVRVGSRVYLGEAVYLSGQVDIGDDVMLAPMVHVTDGYHRIGLVGASIRDSGPGAKVRVHIEDDVWVGARATIMRGVRVGEGSVIGAASLVTKDIPPYVVAVGTPCAPIRRRFDDEELREHLRRRGRTPEEVEALVERRARALAGRILVGPTPSAGEPDGGRPER